MSDLDNEEYEATKKIYIDGIPSEDYGKNSLTVYPSTSKVIAKVAYENIKKYAPKSDVEIEYEKDADAMFEELGYSKKQNAPLVYQKATIRIEFYNYDKTFIKWDFGSARITVNELKAINKKVSEMGWL